MTDAVAESPEAVLERLRSLHADPRRRRSLDIVDAVCRAQHEHGSRDFSLVTIGRLSAARQGPARAALANPAGKAYRDLIAAHERAGASASQASPPAKDDEAELLAAVKSPLHRARIKTAFADARRLAGEVGQWRRKANTLQAVANASATVTVEPGDAAGDLPVAHLGRHTRLDLLPIERTALASVLDPRRLASMGLRVDARGRVLDASNKAVMPIGFATALAKIAAAVGADIGDGSSVTSPTQAPDPRT